jgi:hypothetical protein
VSRASKQRLDRVDWSSRPRGGRRDKQATAARTEDMVVLLRRELRESSALGEFGARAIHDELKRRGVVPLPTVRTIGRILVRRGLLDGRQRVRRPPPPAGWYLPRVAARKAELESFDFVEGLVIRGGTDVMILNGMTIHGGMCSSWVKSSWTAKATVSTLIDHWRRHGLPEYAQFDNDTIFQGAHQWPDSFGRVIRLCLQLGVVPVFAPPRETGFQGAIESYNGRWQAKVWRRFEHDNLGTLQCHSDEYLAGPQSVPQKMEAGPATSSAGDRYFPSSYQQPRHGRTSGTVLPGRQRLAEPLDSCRGQSESWRNPLLPPPTSRTEHPNTGHKGAVCYPEKEIRRVTTFDCHLGMFRHPRCTTFECHSSDLSLRLSEIKPDRVSVNELMLAFIDHAEQRYRRGDGTNTDE